MIMPYDEGRHIKGFLTTKEGFEFTARIAVDCCRLEVQVPQTCKVNHYDITNAMHLLFDLNQNNTGKDDNRLGCVLSYLDGGTHIELEFTDDKEILVHAHDNLLYFESQDEAREYLKRELITSVAVVQNRRLL